MESDNGSHEESGEKITGLEAVRGGDGISNGVSVSCEQPQMPGGVAGNGKRKRTIVRKTVVVVKKLVKKRVPKRVKVGDSANLSEARDDRNLAIEKYNLVDEVIEETAKDIANDSTETLIIQNDVEGNGAVCEVERKHLSKPFCDVVDAEKGNITPETIMETNGGDNIMIGNQLKDCLMENQRIDIARNADMELLRVGLVGEESGILGGREIGRSIDQAESCSGDAESNFIQLSEGLSCSGEMEVLELKKKWKTEIFIGGLDKYAKEEDIKDVFKDVGLVEEVRVVKNPKSVKNRGYGFVRFATASDAKNVLTKYSNVEICGKQCNVAPVNDTIFLGNIDRNLKTEDVVNLLEKAGIEKIDKVTVKTNPNNAERNCGFALVELQTWKDAQTAFKKLQKKDAFGKKQVLKVAWAQPLIEPAEEEIVQVKSVFAECLPSSWDEERVKEYFKRFGEIESVALAKDLSSSRRQDFAFINYTTRDAALTCINVVNRERLEDSCSKVKIAVSLAKSTPKRKQTGHASNPVIRQHLEAEAHSFQMSKELHGLGNRGKAAGSSYDNVKVDNRSTTDELVQLLRQQASTMHNPPHPGPGTIMPDHHVPLPGSKRTFSQVGHDPLYEERVLSRVRVESSYQISSPRSLSLGVDPLHPPYHQQLGRSRLPSDSINRRIIYQSHFQTRDRASLYEDSNVYRRH